MHWDLILVVPYWFIAQRPLPFGSSVYLSTLRERALMSEIITDMSLHLEYNFDQFWSFYRLRFGLLAQRRNCPQQTPYFLWESFSSFPSLKVLRTETKHLWARNSNEKQTALTMTQPDNARTTTTINDTVSIKSSKSGVPSGLVFIRRLGQTKWWRSSNIGGWINENKNEVEGRFRDAREPQNSM
jgi:hypothetical protein